MISYFRIINTVCTRIYACAYLALLVCFLDLKDHARRSNCWQLRKVDSYVTRYFLSIKRVETGRRRGGGASQLVFSMATLTFLSTPSARACHTIFRPSRLRAFQQRLSSGPSRFSSPCATLESGDVLQPQTKSVRSFLRGRTLVLTGATGFLAKVFLEKLLWEQSDVRKVFLIITPRDGHSAKIDAREQKHRFSRD